MRKTGTIDATIRTFQTLRVGQTFIDHTRATIEKVSEFDVAIGVGYNQIVPIAAYIASVRDDYQYAGRLLIGA